jgi:hypothetical protein
MRGSVTNSNGFCIVWLDLLLPSLQLQSITTAHNQWLNYNSLNWVWVWIIDYVLCYDQIFITVTQLRVCWFGAPSLTRGRICRLQLLLALASAVILGSESLRTRGYILLSQIWDFPFRRLLRLAGSRWRYMIPPPHGDAQNRGTVGNRVFLCGPCRVVILKTIGPPSQFCTGVCEESTWARRQRPGIFPEPSGRGMPPLKPLLSNG